MNSPKVVSSETSELGWIPPFVEHLYDVNSLVSEETTFGLFLKALFGYNANPSLTETIGYLGYFVAVYLVTRWMDRPREVAASPS